MNRLKTGIKGFDELVEGGLIEGRTCLVSGAHGLQRQILYLVHVLGP